MEYVRASTGDCVLSLHCHQSGGQVQATYSKVLHFTNSKKNQDATPSNVVLGMLFRFRNLVDVPQPLLAQSQMGDFDDDGDEDLMYLENSNKKLSFLRNGNDGALCPPERCTPSSFSSRFPV